MKPFLILALFLTFGVGYIFLYPSVSAAPNAKITLAAGESVKVFRNGCTLTVSKDTTDLVKVKCLAPTPSGLAAAASAPAAEVTLNAGQKLRVEADACQLEVTKNKPRKVKVRCNPHASVIVGPEGSWTFSGVANIKVGETVGWLWESDEHTVTSGDGTADGLFCSPNNTDCATAPLSNTGAKYYHTFDTAGTFPYYCRVHDGMTSSVVVEEPEIP